MARTVGFFHSGSQGSFQTHFDALADIMNNQAQQKDAKISSRFASDERGKSTGQHLKDLIAERPELLIVAGGPQAVQEAKKEAAGSSTAVVFTSVVDPVKLGFVQSLKKPGGNMTGVAGLTSELDVARLQLLSELLSGAAAKIGVLSNPTRPLLKDDIKKLDAAAKKLKLKLVHKNVSNLSEIETAIKSFKGKVDAMLVTADALFNNLRKEVVTFADGMKAIYQWREFAELGGYMSFGPSIKEAYRQVGEYAARILNGEKPANLPVHLPTRFELVINMDAAVAGGFNIPASLMSRAEFVRTSP